MSYQFLPKKVFIFILTLGVFLLGSSLLLEGILILIFGGGVFYLFRSPSLEEFKGNLNQDIICLSPIFGKVEKVEDVQYHPIFGGQLVKISLEPLWLQSFGVYMPTAGEICFYGETDEKGKTPNKRHSRLKRILNLQIETKKGGKVGLDFHPGLLKQKPKMWVRTGDRGKRAANIGYFPFAGSVHFYIRASDEVMVKEGDLVHAGQTPVAFLKDSNG